MKKAIQNESASTKTGKNESASAKIDGNEGTMGIKDAVVTLLGIIFYTWDVYSDIIFAIDMSMPRCNYRLGK